MIIECLTYFQMKCGIFSFGELQCFSFNEHFIMELIPHLMCQLLLVFGHLNLFLVCEYALQSLCFLTMSPLLHCFNPLSVQFQPIDFRITYYGMNSMVRYNCVHPLKFLKHDTANIVIGCLRYFHL